MVDVADDLVLCRPQEQLLAVLQVLLAVFLERPQGGQANLKIPEERDILRCDAQDTVGPVLVLVQIVGIRLPVGQVGCQIEETDFYQMLKPGVLQVRLQERPHLHRLMEMIVERLHGAVLPRRPRKGLLEPLAVHVAAGIGLEVLTILEHGPLPGHPVGQRALAPRSSTARR